MIRKITSAVVTLVLLVSASGASAESRGLSPVGQISYALDVCKSKSQLDCLEPLEYFDGKSYVPAKFLGFVNSETVVTDPNGNKIELGRTVWETTTKIRTSIFSIQTRLATKDNVIAVINGVTKTGSELFVIVDGPEDDLTTKLKITARTSWIKPENVTLHAWEPSFSTVKITGGNKWIFQGIQADTLNYTSDFSEKMRAGAKADFRSAQLDFHVHHAGDDVNSSFFDPKCAKYGYTVESSNAGGGGRPYWNEATQSVEFAIDAPHLDLEGKLNKGFFYLWVNKEYMKCAWPESGLANANSFSISVYNEDGTKQTATSVISYKKGQLKVAALNFHYSSPTIRLKAKK
jgi:hypothetical protein